MVWWWWLLGQLVACCCAGVLAALWWMWLTRPHVDAPGPPTLPIIGNILDFREMPITMRKLLDFHRKYGDLTRFYVGPVLVMMVAHPDDVQHILVTSKLVDRSSYTTRAMQLIVGDGLVTLDVTRWKVHRKLINPTFHTEILQGFLDAFHEGALFVSERMARAAGAATEVHPPVFLAAIRNVCDTIIGIDADLLIPDALAEEEISAAMKDGMTTVQTMLMRPWLQNRLSMRLITRGSWLSKYMKMLQDQSALIVAMRNAATQEEGEGEGGAPKKRLRMLEALVRPGRQAAVPLSEVQGEVANLIIAGSETTAVTLSYALAALALHPEWQDAARRELREVFGEGDDYMRPAALEDLSRLRVLESIIKETLRLFPTVPLIPRMAPEDIWLSGGRVLVPKGSLLLVMPFVTHRLPQFFPDPLRFDPSRFLEGRVGKEHAYSYLPFSLGPRNCVGSQYARLQLKVYLAGILRRFRFLPHGRWEDLEDSAFSFSLHTIKPIRVTCIPLHDPSTQECPSLS